MNVGTIIAKVGLDGSGFARGAKSVEKNAAGLVSNVRQSLNRMSALVHGSFALAVVDAFNWADNLTDAAESIGITTTELQKLTRMAERAGMEQGDVISMFLKLQKARTEALSSQDIRDAFRSFGITIEDIQNRAIELPDLFKRIAAAFTDDVGQAMDLPKLFGRGGFALQGFLQEAVNGVDFDVVNEKLVETLAKHKDTLDDYWHEVKTGWRTALAGVIQGATTLSQYRFEQTAEQHIARLGEKGYKEWQKKFKWFGIQFPAREKFSEWLKRKGAEEEAAELAERELDKHIVKPPADTTPLGVDELALKAKAELTKATKEADEAEHKLAMSKMDDLQKQKALEKEILDLRAESQLYAEEGWFLISEQLRKEAAIKGLDLQKSTRNGMEAGGAWAKAGRFAGLSIYNNFPTEIWRASLQVQRQIEVNTRHIKPYASF